MLIDIDEHVAFNPTLAKDGGSDSGRKIKRLIGEIGTLLVLENLQTF